MLTNISTYLSYVGEPPSNDIPVGDYPTVITRPSGKKALVVVAHAYGKYLGFLKVNFTQDEFLVDSWEGQPILLDSSIHEGGYTLLFVDDCNCLFYQYNIL